MKHFDVPAILDRAKQVLKIEHDQRLAKLLGVSRTTLASWKRRNSIPAKHLAEVMLYSGDGISFDWLLTGKGPVYRSAEEHLAATDLHLDKEILWLAILAWHLDLVRSNDTDSEIIHDKLDGKKLNNCHLDLVSNYATFMDAKTKWQESGLVSEKDVYKAVATEAGLSDFDSPPVKWWEDE